MKKKLIKFEKESCQPCESVSQYLDQHQVDYESINAFDNPELARAYKVKTVPTVILLDGYGEIARSSGYNPKELELIINSL